jgi:hypothetical protein
MIFKALRRLRSLKIFLTCRPKLSSKIQKYFKFSHFRSMDSPEVHADVGRYISQVLRERRDSGDLEVSSPEALSEIEETLVSLSHGRSVKVNI